MEHTEVLLPQDRLSEKWPWNREFLRLALIVPPLVGIAASAALYPKYGALALWFLAALPIGLVLRLTFGYAGSLVERLRPLAAARGGEVAEALVVVRKLECPGFVVMRDHEVVLMPVMGDELVVPFDTIGEIRTGRFLPGKLLLGKLAFNIGTTVAKPVAFAVPHSIARRWSPRLKGDRSGP